MAEALAAPREELSQYAPRIITLKVKPDRIRDIIGPGGKMINAIIEQTGVAIDVEDDGTCQHRLVGRREASRRRIDDHQGPHRGARGRRSSTWASSSASSTSARSSRSCPAPTASSTSRELAHKRVEQVDDVLKEGDEVLVKVISVDREGKIRLSRKEALGADARSRPQHAVDCYSAAS